METETPKNLLVGMGIRHIWGNDGKDVMGDLARCLGFEPYFLESSGENQYDSPMTREVLTILQTPEIPVFGMIGFSGGAWNMRNICRHPEYDRLPLQRRKDFESNLIAIGAPVNASMFPEGANVKVFNFPDVGHLNEPKYALAEVKKELGIDPDLPVV